MTKYISCKSLESSLFIAHDELRSCCQRFFYNGKMRGDASLVKIEKDKLPTLEDISIARKKIFNEIQSQQSDSCTGCHQLYETKEEPNFKSKLNILSIEQHSVCNLRCSYCSDIYYGGKRPKYDVLKFIKSLSEQGYFGNLKQVVWGGGEPTLDKSFEILLKEIHTYSNPNYYHRVFTNSIKYSEAIAKFLKNGLVKIVTSIDAGTEETFKKIRGRAKFNEVFENLNKYSSIGSHNITIKYILTKGNSSEEELQSFVSNCIKHNLQDCAYQISIDYKTEIIEIDILKKISYLMGNLKKHYIKKIFCDDHIARRFKSLSLDQKKDLQQYLSENNISDVIINNQNIKKINIFGIGEIARNIINKTNFLDEFENVELYDSDIKKIGSKVNKYTIQEPLHINKNNYKILILTAETFNDIYDNLIKSNTDPRRIITGLVI
jgi:molybdenum cofactor biosynthesis enzyme MoaA